MFFRKKQPDRPLGTQEFQALVDQERAVAEQIAKLEDMISEAPDRIRREYEERRNVMPPPDDWEDRKRAKRFNAQLSKGEIRNEHRYQARSTMVFVMLVIAIVSILSYIISFLGNLG